MNIHLEKRSPTAEEYQNIRRSTTWNQLERAQVVKALKSDLFGVCVFVDAEVVGIARVIGDGAIYFYIQDVIVLPKFQKMGLAKMMMIEVENYLLQAAEGYSFIGLMAADGVSTFYKKYGYQERPESAPGMFKTIQK